MPDGHRWNGYSHEELYKQINSGPGPKASHASMERWQGVSAALVEINNELYTGVMNSGARWEGKAADTARAGLNPLAAWADDARTGADVMRVSAEMQADFISKARSDMPAPVPVTAEDPGKILSALTHLVGGQTDYEVQEKAHSAAEQRAREVMATYASSTTTNTSTLGQFHQPPQLVINPSQHSLGNVHGISGGFGGDYGVVSGRGGGGVGRGYPSRQGSANRPANAPRGVAGSTTGTSGATGSPTTSTPGTTRTANGVGGPGTAGGPGGGVIGGGVGSKARKDDTKSAGANDGHASGAGGQATGAGRQSGVTTVSGAEFGPVATPTAQPGGAAGHGGPAGGPAAGTATDNDTVHRRSTPMVPTQSSFDPFGNAGAARANEEEDGEHNAADYLRETDDIYGIGGMISPPVIGENQSS